MGTSEILPGLTFRSLQEVISSFCSLLTSEVWIPEMLIKTSKVLRNPFLDLGFLDFGS